MKRYALSALLILMAGSASAIKSLNDVYSQEKLQELLKSSSRCVLNSTDENAKNLTVAVRSAKDVSGKSVYFVELSAKDKPATLLHLVQTHFIYAGYVVESNGGWPFLGLNVSGTVSHIAQLSGGKSSEVFLTVKESLLKQKVEFSNNCEF
ncbi:hypothetical protein D3C87_301140 [compost metagenome]